MRVTAFVDIFFQMMKEMQATDHTEFTVCTLEDLGMTINWEKSCIEPSSHEVFVGFNVSSVGPQGPWVLILPIKIRKLKRYLRKALAGAVADPGFPIGGAWTSKILHVKTKESGPIVGVCPPRSTNEERQYKPKCWQR